MVIGSRKPPLPAPTDTSAFSSGDQGSAIADDLTTDISRVTDRTHYSVPDDGSPVTITTKKRGERDLKLSRGSHSSQTSLLIEYFEGGKSKETEKSHSSVRVRVRPSAAAKAKGKQSVDPIPTTETVKNRVPSYTRRISLSARGGGERVSDVNPGTISDLPNPDFRPPLEVEVLHQDESQVSYSEQSSFGRYIPPPSDISSMPPDSMLDEKPVYHSPVRRRSRSTLDRDENVTRPKNAKAPSRRRSRSLSRERITQKVMEKLASQQDEQISPPATARRRERDRDRSSSKDYTTVDEKRSSRRRSGRSYKDEASISDQSLQLDSRKLDQQSNLSGASAASSSINNPKLLQTVEDAIRRLILPEINALKEGGQRGGDTSKSSKLERATKESTASSTATSRDGSRQRVSKSSGVASVHSYKSKGSSRHDYDDRSAYREKKAYRSSRDSASEKSNNRRESGDSFSQGDKAYRKKSSKDKQRTKEAIAAGAGSTLLTAAALKHHDSQETVEKREEKKEKEKRKKRSKSGSRSASINDSVDTYTKKKEKIPPMPMQSEIQSDLTRDSILSADRESSRGMETPTRDSMAKRYGKEDYSPARTPTDRSVNWKDAAGSRQTDYFGDVNSKNADRGRDLAVSPIQSAASYEDESSENKSREVKSNCSASRRVGKDSLLVTRKSKDGYFAIEDDSLQTPLVEHLRSKRRPRGITLEKRHEVMDPDVLGNKRHSRHHPSDNQRDSVGMDYKRQSMYTEDSVDGGYADKLGTGQEIRKVDANPQYVHTPVAVESAVASLHEPSTVSGMSSQSSPIKVSSFSYNRDSRLDSENYPSTERALGESTREVQLSPEKELQPGDWKDTEGHEYVDRDEDDGGSPRQSDARSEEEPKPRLGASAIPQAEDPMPEIGHMLDDDHETNTNPSIIQGPLDGGNGRQSLWPYDPTPPPSGRAIGDQHRDLSAQVEDDYADYGQLPTGGPATSGDASRDVQFHSDGNEQDFAREGSADITRKYEGHDYNQSPLQQQYGAGRDEYGRVDTIPPSPANHRDEGYQSAAKTAPSPGGYTPEPYSKMPKYRADGQADNYDMTLGAEDPFVGTKRLRHLSGNSHGMESPLYDSATGKGIDRIESKDVVALMDHLTVRDAQRNARDTEILVTLVRSAAEMRNSFEDMKKFLESQDRMVMHHNEKTTESAVQRLQGPRPQPLGSPRVPRREPEEIEDAPTRRRNVFKRALRGLSLKNTGDLSRIEDMLMQLLTEVEGLKDAQGTQRHSATQSNSMTSYDNLRTAPDPGYEPEGQAGTSSTPNQSDYFSGPESIARHGAGMHSGYDGRRSSENRISTVIEGDEELAEREANGMMDEDYLEEGYEHEERLLTPTQEVRKRTTTYHEPAQAYPPYPKRHSVEYTPRSSDRKSKHKSNNSSIFGIPKISRWSKTTASSAPDTARFSGRRERPSSEASRSGSELNYYDDDYDLHEDDRLRSRQSLAESRRYSYQSGRSGSPLVPEQELDDPKYQAHCNSLNLQHPQPRSGTFHRHQANLETQARNFDKALSPDVEQDQWGSMPSLARHPVAHNQRYSDEARNLSPISSEGGYSGDGGTSSGPPRPAKVIDNGPLVPPKISYNDGEGNSSPYGSGTQLAPIEEVRPSLESERGSDVSVLSEIECHYEISPEDANMFSN